MRAATFALALLAALPSAAAVDHGDSAPAFEGAPLAGGSPVRLDDYRGKVVYLDFWASWCGPCRHSLPWMETLRQEFSGKGFEIIAVNVDESPSDGLAFLQRLNVSYPVVDDSKAAIATLYDVHDMPSSYLIDRRGVVRTVHRGFNRADGERLRKRVARLVAEQP